jgi:hypothetical protein
LLAIFFDRDCGLSFQQGLDFAKVITSGHLYFTSRRHEPLPFWFVGLVRTESHASQPDGLLVSMTYEERKEIALKAGAERYEECDDSQANIDRLLDDLRRRAVSHAIDNDIPRAKLTTPHTNIECDSCEALPIVGARYRCRVCPSYDLCEMCYFKPGIHLDAGLPPHRFDRLEEDEQVPAMVQSLFLILKPAKGIVQAVQKHEQEDAGELSFERWDKIELLDSDQASGLALGRIGIRVGSFQLSMTRPLSQPSAAKKKRPKHRRS